MFSTSEGVCDWTCREGIIILCTQSVLLWGNVLALLSKHHHQSALFQNSFFFFLLKIMLSFSLLHIWTVIFFFRFLIYIQLLIPALFFFVSKMYVSITSPQSSTLLIILTCWMKYTFLKMLSWSPLTMF